MGDFLSSVYGIYALLNVELVKEFFQKFNTITEKSILFYLRHINTS